MADKEKSRVESFIPFARPYFGMEGRKRLHQEIDDIMASGVVSNDERCRKLEERVAKLSAATYAISCSSCSQGLALMLASCGAKGFCKTQSFTWDSTIWAIQSQGFEVDPHDIDLEYWSVKHYPFSQQRCFCLAVDTFGCQVPVTSDVPVFYDRAHSLGVRFRELGVASVLSFSASKIATTGEGGMILSHKKNFVDAMTKGRDLVSRMSEFTAAVGLMTLKDIENLLEWKRGAFENYKKAFPQFQFQAGEGNHQVIAMLMETNAQRDKVMEELKNEIEFKAYYYPMHIKYKYGKRLPITEDVYGRILCLPSWYGCDAKRVIERIKETLNI